MTWNKSERELMELLDEANTWHPNINLDYEIGQSLPFLDVFLINQNGILSTSTYHKPSAEPYVLPFISDHPRHVFVNIVQDALTRSVRYSSTYRAFEHERQYIKLMLLYDGSVSCIDELHIFLYAYKSIFRYPPTLIEDQFRKIFMEYTSISSFLPYVNDEQQFYRMRENKLGLPTNRQSQVTMDVDNANILFDLTNRKQHAPTEINQKSRATEKRTENKLIVHYTH